ncbi:hypothetical protein P343_14630 [Sporolactobacillus laevolacticus DSM 442]|uniref:Uncharacterized protein n=1 Tax=Sporolactobacillus laevolacticus DSM 442 TaxID=1395513 RepID=V6IUT3_9BACL|nr:hypothetical protein P343_14630 [Sporolactobacillus laevolacticus DSM 442]
MIIFTLTFCLVCLHVLYTDGTGFIGLFFVFIGRFEKNIDLFRRFIGLIVKSTYRVGSSLCKRAINYTNRLHTHAKVP